MQLKHSQVIALANQKGGCGKTTTAVNLAAGFALEGYSTCLVDVDSQCNATSTFDVDHEQLKRDGHYTILDVFLSNRPARDAVMEFGARFDGRLAVVPGHRSLDQAKFKLDADLRSAVLREDHSPLDEDDMREEQRLRLKNSLASLRDKFDIIIIDTPPALDFLLTTALIAADWYVIPLFPSGYDLEGLSKLTTTVKKVRERTSPNLQLLGVVLGNYDATTTLDKDIYRTLEERFADRMCKTVIGRSVKFREATAFKKTLFEHAPTSPPARQVRELTRELAARLVAYVGTNVRPALMTDVAVPEAQHGG